MRARKKNESDVIEEIRIALSKVGVPVWRNHVALSKQESGRMARSGLAVGSADLIGLLPPPHGQGTFIALEAKAPIGGRLSEHQRAWLEVVRRCGGIAGVVRGVDEAFALLGIAKEMSQ